MTGRGERGSVTTEVVLVTPILLLLLGFVVFAGRVGGVQQQVLAAVDEGARAASLRGDVEVARATARERVADNLADAGVLCAQLGVEVDTAAFHPGGRVAVTATCAVELGDVAFPGLPGARSYTATSVEVIDRFRGAP